MKKQSLIFSALLLAGLASVIHIGLNAKKGKDPGRHWRERMKENYTLKHAAYPFKKAVLWLIPKESSIDSQKKTYWEIENKTNNPVTVYNNFEEIKIPAGETKYLRRWDTFYFVVETKKEKKEIAEDNHFIQIIKYKPIKVRSYTEWPGKQ